MGSVIPTIPFDFVAEVMIGWNTYKKHYY
jgi:hypothetical protein